MRCVTALMLWLAGFAHAAVPPGLSGSWYDPEHAGHGLSVQVLGDGRAIVYWFTYDPGGDPLHLYIDGVVDDRTIRGPAYAARGMRFGSFDPATLQVPRWGEVEITFATCTSATLRYSAGGEAGAGYGAGMVPLSRLSRLAGLSCDDANLSPPAAGLYRGTYRRLPDQFPGVEGQPLEAAIDTDGLFWAVHTELVPGPQFAGITIPPVVVPERSSLGGAAAAGFGRVLPNLALYPPVLASTPEEVGTLHLGLNGRPPFRASSAGGARRRLESLEVSPDAIATSANLVGRLTFGDLVGAEFGTTLRGQFFVTPLALRFQPDGSFCAGINCYVSGRIVIRSTTHRFFDFTLHERDTRRSFSGRGWVYAADPGKPSKIVMVGSSTDGVGIGLRLERAP